MAFSSWRTWVTGETVTAAHMNQEIRDNGLALFPDEEEAAAWTPTLQAASTDPSIGTVSGRQYRIGALQFVWVRFVFETAGIGGVDTPGSGTYFVELPNPISGLVATGDGFGGQAVGTWQARDANNVSNSRAGVVSLRSSSPTSLAQFSIAEGGTVTAGAPFTWQGSDVLSFHAVYVIDA